MPPQLALRSGVAFAVEYRMKNLIFWLNALVEGGFGVATLVAPGSFLFIGLNDIGEVASLWFAAAILSQGVASLMLARGK